MNLEEYKLETVTLTDNYNNSILRLKREYAISNNKVKVGDIVIDHCKTVLVEKIKIDHYNDIPTCVYYGELLKKDKTPRKRPEEARVHQTNIKEVIK